MTGAAGASASEHAQQLIIPVQRKPAADSYVVRTCVYTPKHIAWH